MDKCLYKIKRKVWNITNLEKKGFNFLYHVYLQLAIALAKWQLQMKYVKR